jgi:hypothetical protein
MAWKGYDERSKRDGETADKCALYAFMCACLCVADIGAFSAVRSLSGLLSEKQAYKIATHQLKGMNLGSHCDWLASKKMVMF